MSDRPLARRLLFWSIALLGPVIGAVAAGPAFAGCFPMAWQQGGIRQAAFQPAALPEGASAQLTFLGHSSFLLETAGGVTAVTDYNDYVRSPVVPDIATMNNAHDTHYTSSPDARIGHVLRGWNPAGGWAEHDIIEGDLRVRNVPTAVHGRSGDQALSNSIFVFELADLCIAHLGHLHHVLTPDQVGELGEIDVVLVPVDGSYTMSQGEMMEVLEQIRAKLVIPMHYFGPSTLERFLATARDRGMQVARSASPRILLSRADLPAERAVLVLPGR